MEATSTLSAEELRAILQAGEPVTIVDVRPAAERDEWSIPGSVHIDAYQALRKGDPGALEGLALPRGVPVVAVCAAGKTSLIAARQLGAQGYEVLSLEGGMRAWSLAWNTAPVILPPGMPDVDVEVLQVRRTGKGCLSYVVASRGDALVIDASLPPQVYDGIAAEHGWHILHVIDTHVHADHLSRSRQLAELTGATLWLPANGRVSFPYRPLGNGDLLQFGEARLTVLSTPGHTPESASYLLNGAALFTGDTLFLNGVGRPDLEATPDEAARRAQLLWGSLQHLLSLLTLHPNTLVLPGHTSEPVPFDQVPLQAPLGFVKERVRLLAASERHFIDEILARIPPAPPNHHTIVTANESGLWPKGDPVELEAGANRCAVS